MNYNINWRILSRASPYSTATKVCYLCNKERYYLLYRRDTYTLNEQKEILRKCRHRRANLLGVAAITGNTPGAQSQD